MVNLTRIYTRTGDGGQTRLSDLSVTSKTDVRVQSYGDVDEANAALGIALATGGLPADVTQTLSQVQNELFDLGADLSNPLAADYPYEPLRITQDYVDRLERWCDHYSEGLPTLRSFILPGGSLAAAHLHLARTVTRRAERSAWAAMGKYGDAPTEDPAVVAGGVNPLALTYLNRLSDLLFILIRVTNGTDGDVLWVPGGERTARAHDDEDLQQSDREEQP